MYGVVLCCTWDVKCPKNDCVLPSCGDHTHHVIPSVCGFMPPWEGKMLGEEGPVLTKGYGVDINSGVYLYREGFTSLFSD